MSFEHDAAPLLGSSPVRTKVDPEARSLWETRGSTYDEYGELQSSYGTSAPAGDTGVSSEVPFRSGIIASAEDNRVASRHPEATLRVYRARWHMIAIFCLQTFTNAFLWISFAPIVELTQRFYAVDVTFVNMLSVIFMILYAPGSYMAMYTITKYGLRTTILVGASLNAVGAWVRYSSVFVARDEGLPSFFGYAVLLLGQTMPALAQPLFTNVPAKLAADWFPKSERDAATVIGALFNPLGNAAGQVIPSLLVSCVVARPLMLAAVLNSNGVDSAALAPVNNGSSLDNCPTAKEVVGMDVLLLIQAILATVSAFWAIGWFRSDPPTPPSRSAAMRAEQRRMLELSPTSLRLSPTSTIYSHLKALMSNTEFLKLLVGFGAGLAVFNAMLTVLGQIVLPLYGNSKDDINQATSDAGMYGGILIGAGMVGAGIIGPILDCTHMYRLILKTGFAMAVGGLTFVLLQLIPDNQIAISVGFGWMGFCMMPLLPTGLEAAVECTFPVPEEMSATLLMLVGNVAGLGLTYLMQYLVSLRPTYDPELGRMTPVSWCLLGAVAFSAAVVFSFQGKYLRLDAEKIRREQESLLLQDELAEHSSDKVTA